MTHDVSAASPGAASHWLLVRQSLARPYRIPVAMVLLIALVPLYILIPEFAPPVARNVPELAVDRALPLIPAWALVYGALYLFLILLPIFVVRQEALVRRTFHAYLFIWITAYLFFFVLYPTAAPRPLEVAGDGFAVWGLRALYSFDPPHNCFPSLHVAHSFVSALASYRVNRNVGLFAIACATLVALSTLFTKQHYVVDVIAGVVLASVAYAIFLAKHPRASREDLDHRAAPALAACLLGLAGLVVIISWLAYAFLGDRLLEPASERTAHASGRARHEP